ncbi:EFR1 family ferrodoxin [Ruminococcus sp.]|uniref:EFR1 family ferrodoxin n=1 Tax=Ruminococcus sp. TaxID=41978 RepID=UPI0025DA8C5E|nr:EFR1 family ferrodoxin [Ruminococcus sp.]MBQ8966124.1 EFR1 family ferrodoxin [Ruminococcus sp.]
MVIYFSGTGNTRYAAEVIGELLHNEVKDIKKLIRQGGRTKFYSEAPYIICAPIYAWRFPPLVEGFIADSDFWGSNEVYFVATCESQTGNAAKYLKKICDEKGLKFMGFAGVPMPENYIVMYKVPDEEEQKKIFSRADRELVRICNTIVRREQLTDSLDMKLAKPFTSLVNPWFFGAVVSTKKFHATDKCISCGKCSGVCPYNSISLKNGRPVWGEKCTHCMACISNCPTEAIEYGRKTVGKPRYLCRRKPKITWR